MSGNSAFASNKDLLAQLVALQNRNKTNQQDIENEIARINNQLVRVSKGTQEEYCLLYTKNELLNMHGEAKYTLPETGATLSKVNIAEPKEEEEIVVIVDSAAAEYVAVEVEPTAVTPLPLPTLNNNKELKFLRDENKKLRRDVNKFQDLAKRQGYSIIRDTVKVMIEKPVIQYVDKIIEKPVIQYVDKIVEKPTVQYVDKIVEKPTIQYVDKIVEKPTTITNTITKVEQLLSLPPDVILFDIGKHAIKPQYNSRLTYYATQLKKYADLKVTLTGHTDATGNPEANKLLSERRASATKAFLMQRGVLATQIETAFNGANSPTEENKSATGKAQNRRVEIQFNK